MRSPEELAREKIDKLLTDCGSSLVTYHLSLSFIPTIQRLYSILSSLRFWIVTLTRQGQISRGDRQRALRAQRSEWAAFWDALMT
jgi:hypothetical protein